MGQIWNNCLLSDFTLLEIIAEVKFLHPAKAPSPIVVTLFGMTTEVNPEPKKAILPILVTLLGISIEDKAVQPSKATAPIEVMLLGMVTAVRALQYSKE